MTQYRIKPSTLSGRMTIPPSKSQTMRALVFASMASGQSVVRRVLDSPDVAAMTTACRQLGADIVVQGDTACVTGVGGTPQLPPGPQIDAGNSGLVLRFITALGALSDQRFTITGDHSIQHSRPLRPLLDALAQCGASWQSLQLPGQAPVSIQGPIQAGVVQIEGGDSQPVSAMMIAAVFLQGETHINVHNPGELPWLQVTLSWLQRFGVAVSQDGEAQYRIRGGNPLQGFEYTVPGDASSMAFPLVAALIAGSEVTLSGLDMTDAQGDKALIHVLQAMGADIVIHDQAVHVRASPVLQGRRIDVNDFIDALPILAVLACYTEGETHLTNAAIARCKESDRLAAITAELTKLGAVIEEQSDGLIIEGRKKLEGTIVHSHHDHRIAMALAVAGCVAQGETIIRDTDCVAKSYPEFAIHMQQLGCQLEVIA